MISCPMMGLRNLKWWKRTVKSLMYQMLRHIEGTSCMHWGFRQQAQSWDQTWHRRVEETKEEDLQEIWKLARYCGTAFRQKCGLVICCSFCVSLFWYVSIAKVVVIDELYRKKMNIWFCFLCQFNPWCQYKWQRTVGANYYSILVLSSIECVLYLIGIIRLYTYIQQVSLSTISYVEQYLALIQTVVNQ